VVEARGESGTRGRGIFAFYSNGIFAVGICYQRTDNDKADWEDFSVCCSKLKIM
jgi:hypothetical protein